MAERELPDLLLERYLLGELPDERLREIKGRLNAEPELRERLASLRKSNETLLRKESAEVFARRLGDRLRRERVEAALRSEIKPGAKMVWGRPAFAGALFLAVLAVPVWKTWNTAGDPRVVDERSGIAPGGAQTTSSEAVDLPVNANAEGAPARATGEGKPRSRATEVSDAIASTSPETRSGSRSDTRLKGLEPGLALFRKTASGAEPLRPGAKARPGDVLRIGYRAADASYGAIYSVDGSGNVTRHWPAEGDRAARLEPGEHLLPGAFELDAAPEYERFYFLVSDTAFELSSSLRHLKSLKGTKTGDADGIRVIRFDLLKDIGT